MHRDQNAIAVFVKISVAAQFLGECVDSIGNGFALEVVFAYERLGIIVFERDGANTVKSVYP